MKTKEELSAPKDEYQASRRSLCRDSQSRYRVVMQKTIE